MKLYSIGNTCKRCMILKEKLDNADVQYDLVTDRSEMERNGIDGVPVLEVDGVMHNYQRAVKLINNGEITK